MVAALESDDDNFGVDEEIDTLSNGLQIDETSTSPTESPSVTDDNTWSDGDEEGEIARNIVAADGTSIALTDVQAAITRGCSCLKIDHMSPFNAAN